MAFHDLGENKVVFEISRDGKVQFNPRASIIATSYEMEIVLQEIVPKVAKHFEQLLTEKFGNK